MTAMAALTIRWTLVAIRQAIMMRRIFLQGAVASRGRQRSPAATLERVKLFFPAKLIREVQWKFIAKCLKRIFTFFHLWSHQPLIPTERLRLLKLDYSAPIFSLPLKRWTPMV